MISLTTDKGNHSSLAWAQGTATTILNLQDVAPERILAAQHLKDDAIDTLAALYDLVIDRERDQLQLFPDQCDNPYNVSPIANYALQAIQEAAKDTPWNDYLHGEWALVAEDTIGNHLSTAVHVERLLFADSHPDNASAVAYKARFHRNDG